MSTRVKMLKGNKERTFPFQLEHLKEMKNGFSAETLDCIFRTRTNLVVFLAVCVHSSACGV